MNSKTEKAGSASVAAAIVPAGQVEHGGKRFAVQADGTILPVELVKPADQLRDDIVRDLVAHAEEHSASLARFKAAAFTELDTLLDVLASQYRVVLGGRKGNVVFESMDGTLRVQIAVADRITFGPELQIAKASIDGLIRELGGQSPPLMVALVENAFQVSKEGNLNAGALLGLRRIDHPDERWTTAMKAITDSIKVVGSKRYIRFHKRSNPESTYVGIPTSLSDV